MAKDLLTKPGGAAGAFAAVQQLSSLSQESTLALLAAVAAGCRELGESDGKLSRAGKEAAQCMPGPEVLAHWRDGGCKDGTFTFTVPHFSRLRAKGQSSVLSPVFSAEGRRWQLQLFPNGQGSRPASMVLFLRSWDLACSTARRNDTFATEFNLGLLCQARISPCWCRNGRQGCCAMVRMPRQPLYCQCHLTVLCCRTQESGGCVSFAPCSLQMMCLGAQSWQSYRVSAPAVAFFHVVPFVLMWWLGCDGWSASIVTIISGQPRLSVHLSSCRAPSLPRLRQE